MEHLFQKMVSTQEIILPGVTIDFFRINESIRSILFSVNGEPVFKVETDFETLHVTRAVAKGKV